MAEKKPFVRYLVTGDINDKGLAFSVKRALGSFLESHGHAYRVMLSDKSSDKFEAIVELFDSDKPDFNMQAFKDHLAKSGRIPLKPNVKPKISISTIPVDYSSTAAPTSSEDKKNIPYEKVIDDLHNQRDDAHKKLDESERTRSGLIDMLKQSQDSIEEKSKQIASLETRLKNAAPVLYPGPVDALVRSYLPSCLENLFESVEDFNLLNASDRNAYITNMGSLSYLKYINEISGMEFKGEADIKEFKAKFKDVATWEDSEEAKGMESLRNKARANEEVLSTAEKTKVGEEIVGYLRAKLEEVHDQIKSAEASADSSKELFRKQKNLYSKLGDLDKRYAIIRKVSESSEARRKSGAMLPAVVTWDDKKVRAYLPSVNSESDLEKHIIRGIIESLKNEEYSLSCKHNGSSSLIEVSSTKIEAPSTKEGRSYPPGEAAKKVKMALIEDRMIYSLGLKPDVITVA